VTEARNNLVDFQDLSVYSRDCNRFAVRHFGTCGAGYVLVSRQGHMRIVRRDALSKDKRTQKPDNEESHVDDVQGRLG